MVVSSSQTCTVILQGVDMWGWVCKRNKIACRAGACGAAGQAQRRACRMLAVSRYQLSSWQTNACSAVACGSFTREQTSCSLAHAIRCCCRLCTKVHTSTHTQSAVDEVMSPGQLQPGAGRQSIVVQVLYNVLLQHGRRCLAIGASMDLHA